MELLIFNICKTPALLKRDLLLLSLVAFAFSPGCQGRTSHINPDQHVRGSLRRDIRKKPPSSFQDSLFINIRSVIFFEPDSLQMENIRRVNEKMIFESLTHDCFYKMRNSRLILDKNWPGIPVRLASKTRWLVFRKTRGADSIIDLNAINDICGIYLFDPTKDPVRIDMTNIASELGFYFKQE